MFQVGTKVFAKKDGAPGHVISNDGVFVNVMFDDGLEQRFVDPELGLISAESAPGPSESADPIHAYYLKHARNAGAAVQALRIIREEAEKTLGSLRQTDGDDERAALKFIGEFCNDVLSHVLPS